MSLAQAVYHPVYSIQEWCPTLIHVSVLILAVSLCSFQLLSFFLPCYPAPPFCLLHCCLPPAPCRHWPKSVKRCQASPHLSYPAHSVLRSMEPSPSSQLSHSGCGPYFGGGGLGSSLLWPSSSSKVSLSVMSSLVSSALEPTSLLTVNDSHSSFSLPRQPSQRNRKFLF